MDRREIAASAARDMAIQISLRWVWGCLSGTGFPPAVAILQPSRFQIGLRIEASAMRMLIKAANQLQWFGTAALDDYAAEADRSKDGAA